MNAEQEAKNINNIAANSLYCAGVNYDTILYSFEILARHIKPKKILELGPAEGIMTEKLNQVAEQLFIVEGAKNFAENLQTKYPELKVTNSLFEDFETAEKFDTIVLGHVLEHVENPVEILKKCKQWLSANGIVFAAVPNSHSIHRQAAVLMGLLEKEDFMSQLDIHHGHRRVYNIESFKSDFVSAGLQINQCGGYWLKPVSNKQIEETWTPEMLAAFMKLGESYPEIAGEIYVIAGL